VRPYCGLHSWHIDFPWLPSTSLNWPGTLGLSLEDQFCKADRISIVTFQVDCPAGASAVGCLCGVDTENT